MLIGGCCGTTPKHIAAVRKVVYGAMVTIGFSEEITCLESCDWTKLFYTKLLGGYTVKRAAVYASENANFGDTTESCVVYGSGNSIIVQGA